MILKVVSYLFYALQTFFDRKLIYKSLTICSIVLLASSCTPKVQLERDEYRLNNFEFKGNKQISTEELDLLIPPTQRPNRRILYLPVAPYVGFYNLGKSFYRDEKINKRLKKWQNRLEVLPNPEIYDAKIERKRKRFQNKINIFKDRLETKENWWMKNIGEAPAIITENAIKRTSSSIHDYLYSKGYFDNKVSYKIDSVNTNKRVKLTYLVDEKSGYRIDSIKFNVEDIKIDSLLKKYQSTSLLKSNKNIDFGNIDAEKIRIESFFKENGYFNFIAKNYISVEIDTTDYIKRGYKVNLGLNIRNPLQKEQHEQFTLESVNFISADASSDNSLKIDTTNIELNSIRYTFIGKKFPARILDKKILIRPNQLFKASLVNETNRQLYGLDQFAFANVRFTQLPENKLRADIIAPTNPKYTTAYNFDVNNINNILGGGASISLRARNLLSMLETTELGLRANLEGQPGLDSTTQRSRELGANLALNIPKIIFLGKISNLLSLKSPRTQLALSFNNSKQRLFERQVFRLTGNYSWQRSKYETILISPFDINLINTPFKSAAFEEVLINNPNLKVLYDPQFVSSINATYIFNNQQQGKNTRAKYFRLFVESGGTTLNFFPNKNQIKFIDNIFPLDTPKRAYFRFVKINFDYRRYIPINQRDSWAFRLNMGVAHPYGQNRAMPFEKNFFIGGPNSIRAWQPRSLGPGSAAGTTINNRFSQQPGDIILESSVELRKYMFRFIGNWNLGLFVDAGNVWKWYQIESKYNQANFDWGRFYKEIAVGTGAGIRLDLDYFVARIDWGIKVFDPAKPVGQRFVLDELKLSRKQEYYPALRFAIGYPF
ncbi:surface antigen (D15) [Emticicia oligotrophica DSM 17448]|uniref:Surface antigen (D15) n=1 Tax=Emticicia oligotrophica (strain DSM 17448 / CIP 109782 / MTCC 6937 / GPTSA100-15) TaxID=929562 RepID=A0ABM5N5R1_EMTOG|nr:BamA/TamA family outer membrane protein [Emticicia oligotrophica]AFK04720.1 surface antigen (D15) [Emticicia oligotrophica DSM 17448]